MNDNNLSRRRILQVSGAAAATSVGVVGTAAGKHNPATCDRTLQCEASITFEDQTVGDDCNGENDGTPDSVVVSEATLPCGGFIDVHDPDKNTATFGKGHPVGATEFLASGTYSNVCIDLFEDNENGPFGSCINWDRQELNNEQQLCAMLHLDTDNNTDFTHYCQHDTAASGTDHAYLCDEDGDGNLEPVQDCAVVSPDSDEV